MKSRLFSTLALILLLLNSSCEKDDICPEATPTTPQLVIRFYDIVDNDETKSVSGLFAYGLDESNNAIPIEGLNISTTDSITIPLRTDQTSTRFVLHSDFDIEENDPDDPNDDVILGNPDAITVNYTPEDVYVSRACGFKTVFRNLVLTVDNDAENWIINTGIVINDVEQQTQAHVQVFH
ncbi:MAG: hypothetical protein HKO90_05325 [Flavobacteriaceae bacterium]|nr:hypothetical protein [Flavobacteriaceae bacterium]